MEKKFGEKSPPKPPRLDPAVACLLSAKIDSQNWPLAVRTPGLVCGVARGTKTKSCFIVARKKSPSQALF